MPKVYSFMFISFLLLCLCLSAARSGQGFDAVSLSYMVYNPATGQFDKEIQAKDGYELLAGDANLGSIIPVAVFRNAAPISMQFNGSLITEINKKDLSAMKVVNNGIKAEKVCIYDDVKRKDDTELTGNSCMVPPGAYVRAVFPPVSASKPGALEFTITAPGEINDQSVYDFINNVSAQSVIKARLSVITFAGSDMVETKYYNNEKSGEVLLENAWLYSGVDSLEADFAANQPHGVVSCISNPADSNLELVRNVRKRIPRFNALDEKQQRYGDGNFDKMSSHILDFAGKQGTIVDLYYQRYGLSDQWLFRRGWCDWGGLGPEHRVVADGDVNKEIRKPDELILEFISADENHLYKLLNVPEEEWNIHPRRGGAPPVTGNPPLTIFGGGGYRTGFLESDSDSALSYDQGLRADIYDDGKDAYFRRASVMIPDTFINKGRYFRFRIRENSIDHSNPNVNVKDDDDVFFIESLKFIFPCECGDIQMSGIKVHNPYTILPTDFSAKIPVSVVIDNNVQTNAPTFITELYIRHEYQPKWKKLAAKIIPFMPPASTMEVFLDTFDIKDFRDYLVKGNNKFQLLALVYVPGTDMFPENDTLFTEYSVYIDNIIGYGDGYFPQNDVNDFIGSFGALNLHASSDSYDLGDHKNLYGSGSGQIAVSFELAETDTVFGIQAAFSWPKDACYDMELLLYYDNNGLPGPVIPKSIQYRQVGSDDILYPRDNRAAYDSYGTYLFKEPLILSPGRYWAAVVQLGEMGIYLGGESDRMGMATTSCALSDSGKSNLSLFLDESLKKPVKRLLNPSDTGIYSYDYVNANYFAFENNFKSGNWVPFSPEKGNPAYAHKDFKGNNRINGNEYPTYQRGSFIPMLRVYMGGEPRKAPQSSEDAILWKLDIPGVIYPGDSLKIKGYVLYHGKISLNKLSINYKVEDKPVVQAKYNYLYWYSGYIHNFTHPLSAFIDNSLAGKKIRVKVWISDVNDSTDVDQSNDTLTAEVQVGNGSLIKRNVLVEEFTSTECGICIDGRALLDSIADRNPYVIEIAHHDGNGHDKMTIADSWQISYTFNNGDPPSASVDRTLFNGKTRIALNKQEWKQAILERESVRSPLAIKLYREFNETTRKLTIPVELELVDYLEPGDLRLNVFVVEDSVSRPGSEYDQANDFNDTLGHMYYKKGDPMKNYLHRNVIRDQLSEDWGDYNIFKGDLTPRIKFSKTYTYQVPVDYNESHIYAVAFVTCNQGNNFQVINAASSRKPATGIEDYSNSDMTSAKLYPNPITGRAVLEYYLPENSRVRISVINALGKESALVSCGFMSQGLNRTVINTEMLPEGMYVFKIMRNEGVECVKGMVGR